MTRLPERLAPGDFQVRAYPHPLTTQRVDGVLEAGCSLADMLGPGVHAHAFVNGDFVPREWWGRCYPKPGTLVVLRAIPQGGDDKSVLRMIAMITLAVVAPMVGGAIAGAVGLGGSQLAVSAVTVGVQLVGSLAINALIPPPKQDRPEFSGGGTRLPAITGTRNRSRPFGTFVRYYGRHKAYPDAAAQPFTEVQGEDQFLRQVFCLGPGPLKISDIRIGETPIDNFQDVQYETREGWDDDDPLTLYAEGVQQTNVGATIDEDAEAVVRTVTLTEPGEVTLDLLLPQGLAWYEKDGDDCRMTLGFLLEAAENGTGNYSRVTEDTSGLGHSLTLEGYGFLQDTMYPEQGDPDGLFGSGDWDPQDPGTWETVTTSFGMQGKNTDSRRTSITFSLPAGQYDIRMTRILGVNQEDDGNWDGFDGKDGPPVQSDSRGQVFESLVWQTIRTITSVNPVQRPGLALIAVRIRATDQLQNVIDELNCIVESYLKVWDPNTETWNWEISSNPAWAYRDVFTGSANGRPLAESRMDDAAIIEWANACDAEGREFNAPIEGSNVFQAARDIAACGRAAFSMHEGKYSVVRDVAQPAATQMFTPRNSSNFKASRAFTRLPHALKVKWVDPDADWQEAELIVYADGYDSSNATRFETLELFGATNQAQVWKDGKYHLAVGKLRPETYELEADFEYIACRRGDRIKIQHDCIAVGLGSGRLAGVTTDANGDITAVTLDEPVSMSAGTDYALRIRNADGDQVYGQVTTVDGDSQTLTFTAPLAATAAEGDLWAFGELDAETLDALVKEIRPLHDLRARIVAVPYAEAIYTADSGTVPDYDPVITLPRDPADRPPEAPVVDAIQSDEFSAQRHTDRSVGFRLRVAFSVPDSNLPRAAYVQVQAKPDYAQTWRTASAETALGEVYFDGVAPGDTYDIRLRSISGTGHVSAWVSAGPHTITGVTSPLPDITGLAAVGRLGGVRVSWDDISDSAADAVELLAGTTDVLDDAITLKRVPVADAGADHEIDGDVGYYYWARSVGAYGGNKGAVAGPVFARPGRSPDYVRDTLSASDWAAATDYLAGQVVVPSSEVTLGGTVVHFQALDGGTSGGSEPNWASLSAVGDTIVDNNITWEAVPRGKVPFVVGILDGVPVVYMPGAVIEELSVGTLQLKDGAVTNIDSVLNSSEVDLPYIDASSGWSSASFVDIATLDVTVTPNTKREILLSGQFSLNIDSGSAVVLYGLYVALYRDGSEIDLKCVENADKSPGVDVNNGTFTVTLMDPGASGTVQYKLKAGVVSNYSYQIWDGKLDQGYIGFKEFKR